MNNNYALGIVDAIGYPIVILKDDRNTMKIKDIIDRARILEAEKAEQVEKTHQENIFKEFEELYKILIAKIKETNTTTINIKCYIKYHNSADTLKGKLSSRFISDGLPATKEIYIRNDIDEDAICKCFWSSTLCCCIPLVYWAFYFGHNKYKGDPHTIRISF